MGQGWENDMESSRSRTRSHGSDVIEDTSQHSAIRIYGDVVVDLDDQGRVRGLFYYSSRCRVIDTILR